MFHRLLQWVSRTVAERPVLTLAVLAALTLVFGMLAREQQLEAGASPFQVESQQAEDLDTINETFGAQNALTSIQIMVPLPRHRIRKVSLSLKSLIQKLS
ncbi:MAG: hypothetical protein ACERLM_05625, partial [Acidimicrobiales bacterium]